MNEKWKGDGTRRNPSGGLEELGRRTGTYVIESAPEDFRAGENAVSRRNGVKLIESCYLSRVFSCL